MLYWNVIHPISYTMSSQYWLWLDLLYRHMSICKHAYRTRLANAYSMPPYGIISVKSVDILYPIKYVHGLWCIVLFLWWHQLWGNSCKLITRIIRGCFTGTWGNRDCSSTNEAILKDIVRTNPYLTTVKQMKAEPCVARCESEFKFTNTLRWNIVKRRSFGAFICEHMGPPEFTAACSLCKYIKSVYKS